ncbi:MAG: TatA/E family twin arginine-targeting protein translocase [Oscillatoriales cyanobacterium]|jgi:sec-independent protein translocase protein TatA|nr:MAG: TatA/E family twin arginine-targeting protein translocase [Oscillatoriales cyanobacterium]
MNVFGIGLPEMIVILVLALLVFGPKKLPEIGSSLGKAIRGFQDATKEFESELKEGAKPSEPASVASAASAVTKSAEPATEKASDA